MFQVRMTSPRRNEIVPQKQGLKEQKILRNKERWTQVSALLKAEGTAYTKAKIIGESIAMTVASADDFRRIMRFLNLKSEKYHTYTLQKDLLLPGRAAASVSTVRTKCVGKGDSSSDCKQKLMAPTKCVNCGEPHPASYRR